MSEHKCNKCGKIFNSKRDHVRHINKKKDCKEKNITKTFECDKCNKTYSRKDNLMRHICVSDKRKTINETDLNNIPHIDNNNLIQINHNVIKDIMQYNDNLNQANNNSTKIYQEKYKYVCEYCEKRFTRSDILTKHINKCNERIEQKANKEFLEKMIIQLQNQLNHKDEVINDLQDKIQPNTEITNSHNTDTTNSHNTDMMNSQNTTIDSHNTTINNAQIINNNINLVAFGKENLGEIISDAECKRILFKGFEAVPALVERVHFNKATPQYHNCYISNLRGKYAIIYDGENWILKKIDDVIEELKDNKRTYLENKFEDFYDSLCDNTKKKFERFLLEVDTDVVISRYKESLTLLLYNKKGIILDTRKKFDTQNKLLK